MKKLNKTVKKTHWLRNTLIVLIACGIVGTALSAVLFLKDPPKTGASASLLLSFNGAASGQAPNGNEYDLASEVVLDQVLEKAIEKAGMTGKYTVEQIRDNLKITGSYPDDIASQVLEYDSLLDFSSGRQLLVQDYYPTQYTLTLYNFFDTAISDGGLQDLVRGITEAYREYFINKYSLRWDSAKGMEGWDSLDYSQQMDVLSMNLSQAVAFMSDMYQKEPSFKVGGIGFNDIVARLQSVIDNEIDRLQAYITQNALTKHEGRLLTQYRYRIENWTEQVKYTRDELKELDSMIAAYEKGEIIYLSTAANLSQVGGSASSTYDSLVRRRTGTVDEINETLKKIARERQRVQRLVDNGAVSLVEAADLLATEEDTAESTAVKETAATGETGADVEGAGETPAATAAEETTAKATGITEEERQATRDEKEGRLITRIEKLMAKQEAILQDLDKLLIAYNEQEMTEGTIRLLAVRSSRPSLISGAFIAKTVKIAGPFCAVGFIVCMVLLIVSRKKEELA